MLPPLCSQGQHLCKHPCCPNIWVIYCTKLKFPTSTHRHTHTHTQLFYIISTYYVSTRAYHIHHKRGVTEVWHIAHFWVPYGRCAMPENLWDSQKDCPGHKQIVWSMIEIPGNIPLCMPLGHFWQSCHDWITYRSVCRVVIAMIDHVTCGTISHM